MDKAAAGAEALKAGNFTEAISKYTEALAVSPTSPDYYIKRSTAHSRTSPPDHQAAFDDAERGVIYARQRAKRELIVQAQLRRAISLFGLERYADSQFVLSVVKRLDEKEKSLAIWETKCAAKLKALSDDDQKRQVTVKEVPEQKVTDSSGAKPEVSVGEKNGQASKVPAPQAPATAPKPEGVQTPADKIKHDWYQNGESVFISLLAKGVPKDKAIIDIQNRSISISFPMPNGSTYDFHLEPLYDEIDKTSSSYSIMSTKVEFVLRKSSQGLKWKTLETDEPIASQDPSTQIDEGLRRTVVNPSTTTSGPAYPTSSKSGPKNWDKIVDSYDKKPKPQKSKSASDSEPEDDDNDGFGGDLDDEGGGDDATKFFKKLYKGADPDTQRAMMKSFQESNGTALSTNWAEVKKGKVETSPPDGMEAHKWEY
ncbi:MAG: hypothetical protein M1820_008260 [Bogoriella megaspora]|nr:MAG: hypothetical protein M1820_008260 [Bogoriella megaspora]